MLLLIRPHAGSLKDNEPFHADAADILIFAFSRAVCDMDFSQTI